VYFSDVYFILAKKKRCHESKIAQNLKIGIKSIPLMMLFNILKVFFLRVTS